VGDPYFLNGSLACPFDGRQLIAGVIDSAWRGVDLAEVVDGKAAGAQDRKPLPVAGMELLPDGSGTSPASASMSGKKTPARSWRRRAD
jgi:hypothetical protein